MKFTLSWLKDYLESDKTAQEIGDALTSIGLELEEIIDPNKIYEDFFICTVESFEKHPEADRLNVCQVNYAGDKNLQIICGASNVAQGMKAVLALPGTYVPGIDVTLSKGKIRGIESQGMMCSERELCLSDEHDGIISLPSDAPMGMNYADYLASQGKQADIVFDIAITPNRGDCLGVYGIARDLAAKGIGTLKLLDITTHQGTFPSPIQWQIADEAKNDAACSYVAGRYFKNIQNKPSPQWLQERLQAIGLRPISALVDITNYVMMDIGRPLHVFDADRLKGGQLRMAFANDGDKILALDGKEYALESGMLVIKDTQGAQGIAGIMGGEHSGCQDNTINMFLEAALFDPIATALTGRKLNIESDARYRFERGIDANMLHRGIEMATQMVLELCGTENTEISYISDDGVISPYSKNITYQPSSLALCAGVEIASETQKSYLTALGFDIDDSDGDAWSINVPSWRNDIEGAHCLIEEILRLYGFDNIESVSLPRMQYMPSLSITPLQRRRSLAKRQLAMRGMMETITWSFVDEDSARAFAGDEFVDSKATSLMNPIADHLAIMRPSILISLLQATKYNLDQAAFISRNGIHLFEFGGAYHGNQPDDQHNMLAGVRVGYLGDNNHWHNSHQHQKQVDAYDMKQDALSVLEICGVKVNNLLLNEQPPQYFHPTRAAGLRLGGKILCWFGEIHPKIAQLFGFKQTVQAFEIFIDDLPVARQKSTTKPAMVHFPLQPISRDFAFWMDSEHTIEQLLLAVKGSDKQHIIAVDVFDIYKADDNATQKSVAIRVWLQPQGQTSFSHDDLNNISDKIINNANNKAGAVLRS